MKFVIALGGLLLFGPTVFCQKVDLDTIITQHWENIDKPAISNNGLYVYYVIKNRPIGSQTIVVTQTNGKWTKELRRCNEAIITSDNKLLLYRTSSDSLCLFNLDTGHEDWVSSVKSFKTFVLANSNWIGVFHKSTKNELVLRNLDKPASFSIEGAKEIFLPPRGLIIKGEARRGDSTFQWLKWITDNEPHVKTIWEGAAVSSPIFDSSGQQVAFWAKTNEAGRTENIIGIYRRSDSSLLEIPELSLDGLDKDFQIRRLVGFNNAGANLIVRIAKNVVEEPLRGSASVDVWTYLDSKLQAQQLFDFSGFQNDFLAFISLSQKKICRVQGENEIIFPGAQDDQWCISTHRSGDKEERNWNSSSIATYCLTSMIDGQRKALPQMTGILENNVRLSPFDNCLVYYDSQKANYYSLELRTQKITNLTETINSIWSLDDDRPESKDYGLGVAGWLSDGASVLLYDRFDIWKVDLSGKRKPVNITAGFGAKHKIVFRLGFNYRNAILNESDTLLLSAFDKRTKENGFYTVSLQSSNTLEKRTMGNYFYYAPEIKTLLIPGFHNYVPLKARDVNIYILTRMSATESQNIFVTSDFRHFEQKSFICPECGCKWLKSEMVSFLTPSLKLQGILYTPEYLDRGKKYPVIMHYYERASDGLNIFMAPGLSNGDMNIPWFMNKGFIVFVPDIYYERGNPGKSALSAIVGGARFLKTRKFVDTSSIALWGHSFGGFETNYVITHSKLFAAAITSAGVSDAISSYSSLWGDGKCKMETYELRQHRIGTTLWADKDAYIENSPVLFANHVYTPLLLIHNKKDTNVPFSQGVEFFTALRRLGKKVWMLQYDNGSHGLDYEDKTSTFDLTLRVTQFLDHFLKGQAAPEWMTKGVSAAEKGRNSGLKVDKDKRTLGAGLLTGYQKR